jgi:hypothetical protein
MKYQITKEQYSKLVYKLIDAFFKDVKFKKDKRGGYLTITVDGEDTAFIHTKKSPHISEGCKNELVIYDKTILKITNFVPIFKKKVFSKILIKYFSDITGEDIDCIYFDMKHYRSDDTIVYAKKFKKKK